MGSLLQELQEKEVAEHSLTTKETKEIDNDTITRNNHTDNANNNNISDTNTLDSQLHTTPQGNERVMGDISTQSRVYREGRLRESTQLQDISFNVVVKKGVIPLYLFLLRFFTSHLLPPIQISTVALSIHISLLNHFLYSIRISSVTTSFVCLILSNSLPISDDITLKSS